jgi:DNA-binding PucR family transcriptional regulator
MTVPAIDQSESTNRLRINDLEYGDDKRCRTINTFGLEVIEESSADAALETIKAPVISCKVSKNIIIEIQKLIAEVFAELARLSESDSRKTEEMKAKYQQLIEESADLMKRNGNAGPIVSFIGIAILVGTLGGATEQVRELGKFVSGQTPQIAGMLTTRWQAMSKLKGDQASLTLQECIEKIQNKQSDSNKKQDWLKILEAFLDAQKRASQSN